MRLLVWLFRAFVFFTLFAFALNNQQTVDLHGFFGLAWHSPLILVVLVAFTAGIVVGVLAMVPAWWRGRGVRAARPDTAAPPLADAPPPPDLRRTAVRADDPSEVSSNGI